MQLKIQKEAWQKIAAYVDHCPYEIGGLGQVICDGEDFIVSDVEIFTQKVTAAHVDLTAETLAVFQTEKIRAKQSLVNYKFWWHSHAKMDAFFSGTDTNTIDESGAEFPWLVSFVTNHAHKKIARLDIYKPVHVHCTLDVEIVEDVNLELIEACKADIAAKVTMPPPMYTGGYFGKYYPSKHDYPEVPPRKTSTKLSKKDKRRVADLERDLERKERVLRHLEQIEKPSVTQVEMIERTEGEIADISLELDRLQGLDTTPETSSTLPTLPLPHRTYLD